MTTQPASIATTAKTTGKKITIDVPLNRVEGDLEIRADIVDGVVQEAWCSGTMFRGFERILVGRGAMDGLVLTPRICGICSTSHLTAAVRALDEVSGVQIPINATRIRNLAQLAENLQSDLRHTFLMFAVDLVNPAYRSQPLFDEAQRRYAPLAGESAVEVIRETKKLLEVIAIVGGQWPHSAFMVPGGIASIPSASNLMQCKLIVARFRRWYEERVLGCSVEAWAEVRCAHDLEDWLEAKDAHRNSELGFLLRYARAIGLHELGRGCGGYLSFGALPIPEGSRMATPDGQPTLIRSGFLHNDATYPFEHDSVTEHVAHSWFKDYDGGRHPYAGETEPYASGYEGKKYTWAKAPRYADEPAETGPLAEALLARQPLMVDLVRRHGPTVLVRQLARLVRPAELLPALEAWISEATNGGEGYTKPAALIDGQGVGLTQATRGALGHWVQIEDGRITRYQIITPTAWNASPRDSDGTPGPIEQALVGARVADPENPVELGHIVRSFDPCLVCTVHTLHNGKPAGRSVLGI